LATISATYQGASNGQATHDPLSSWRWILISICDCILSPIQCTVGHSFHLNSHRKFIGNNPPPEDREKLIGAGQLGCLDEHVQQHKSVLSGLAYAGRPIFPIYVAHILSR
jgi:hypothetical protein